MNPTKGRELSCLDDAETFLRRFMAEGSDCSQKGFDPHNHDFDLYLPWVFQCIQGDVADGPLKLCDLSVLLMDAAWSLSQKGYLRPGPRSVMGEDLRGSGKGYSLTMAGRKWVAEARERMQAAA